MANPEPASENGIETLVGPRRPPIPFPIPGVRLDAILAGVCRERQAALEGIGTLVDVLPAGLLVSPTDARQLEGCVGVLVDVALATDEILEIDLAARRGNEDGGGSLILAVRGFVATSCAPASAGARASELVRIAHFRVQRSGGTLLTTHREAREHRYAATFDVRSWLAGAPPRRLAEMRLLVSAGNARLRRGLARLATGSGYLVEEAARPAELLRSIDPTSAELAPPDVVLIDEAWLAGSAAGPQLRAAVEAALPPERVLLLARATEPPAATPQAWRRLRMPLDAATLQGACEAVSAGFSERNADGLTPYSLSR